MTEASVKFARSTRKLLLHMYAVSTVSTAGRMNLEWSALEVILALFSSQQLVLGKRLHSDVQFAS